MKFRTNNINIDINFFFQILQIHALKFKFTNFYYLQKKKHNFQIQQFEIFKDIKRSSYKRETN